MRDGNIPRFRFPRLNAIYLIIEYDSVDEEETIKQLLLLFNPYSPIFLRNCTTNRTKGNN